MTFKQIENKISQLEAELRIHEAGITGWQERNLPENLEISNNLNTQIFELNKQIGFTYYL